MLRNNTCRLSFIVADATTATQGDPISASQAGVVYSEASSSEDQPKKKSKNSSKKDEKSTKPAPAVSSHAHSNGSILSANVSFPVNRRRPHHEKAERTMIRTNPN